MGTGASLPNAQQQEKRPILLCCAPSNVTDADKLVEGLALLGLPVAVTLGSRATGNKKRLAVLRAVGAGLVVLATPAMEKTKSILKELRVAGAHDALVVAARLSKDYMVATPSFREALKAAKAKSLTFPATTIDGSIVNTRIFDELAKMLETYVDEKIPAAAVEEVQASAAGVAEPAEYAVTRTQDTGHSEAGGHNVSGSGGGGNNTRDSNVVHAGLSVSFKGSPSYSSLGGGGGGGGFGGAAVESEIEEILVKMNVVAEVTVDNPNNLMEFLSTDGIHWLVSSLERFHDNTSVAVAACLTLSHLAAHDPHTNELCREAGVTAAVVEAMESHVDHAILQRLAVRTLRLLAIDEKILYDGCVEACAHAMQQHPDDAVLASEGCRFFYNVATGPTNTDVDSHALLEAADALAICLNVNDRHAQHIWVSEAATHAVEALAA